MSRGRAAGRALATVGLLAAGAYFLGMARDLALVRLVAKPVPALVLAAWVLARCRDVPGRLVSAGLVSSALADTLLELGLFLPGLAGFLLAHLGYIAGFVAADARPALARAVPFAAFGAGAYLLLRPGLGAASIPVALYAAVLCTMMWRAAARVGGRAPASAAWAGLAGAIAFAASDAILAANRFSRPIPGAGGAIMALYWLGQWGIAASAALACRPGNGMLPRR